MSNVYLTLLLVVSAFFRPSTQFDIPGGLTPKEIQVTDSIEVYASELSAPGSLLKFNYYQLDFCAPTNAKKETDAVSGSMDELTPYIVL